jgi:Mor family transcriptional regulator
MLNNDVTFKGIVSWFENNLNKSTNRSLTNKIYRFCQKIEVWLRRNIGLTNKYNFKKIIGLAEKYKLSQEEIKVLSKDRSLTSKIYRFSQKIKV